IDPFGHTRVGIARENCHRPFVVAGPLYRVPGRRISGPVIDEVQLGIVRIPAPSRAAADFPLIALPGLEARIFANGIAEFRCLLRTDEHFIVRARRIRAPYPLTSLHVIGSEMAADAELSTGDASQHFVLHDHWRRRAGLALGRVAVLD